MAYKVGELDLTWCRRNVIPYQFLSFIIVPFRDSSNRCSRSVRPPEGEFGFAISRCRPRCRPRCRSLQTSYSTASKQSLQLKKARLVQVIMHFLE